MNSLHKFLISFFMVAVILPLPSQAAIYQLQPQDFPASTFSIYPFTDNINILKYDVSVDFRNYTRYYYTAPINLVIEFDYTPTEPPTPLVFTLTDIYDNYEFKLNGVKIDCDTAKVNTIPLNWLPPDSVLFKNYYLPYYFHDNAKQFFSGETHFTKFTLNELPAGRHTVTINYTVNYSVWYGSNDLGVYKSYIHRLNPDSATTKSIEQLSVSILIPDNCEYFTNIPLNKTEIEHGILLTSHFENFNESFLSIVLHKNDKKTKAYSCIFLIISWLLLIFLCLFLLLKLTKKLWTTPYTPAKKTLGLVLFFNYLTSVFILSIEIGILIFLNNKILWLICIPLLLATIGLVRHYYPDNRTSRFILRFINGLNYGLALLLSIYFIITTLESAIIFMILFIIFLFFLQYVAKFSSNRTKYIKLIRTFKNLFYCLGIALVITVGFYLIIYTNETFVKNMMGEFLYPNYGSVLIILLSPLIYLTALICLLAISYIAKKIYLRKLRFTTN